MPIFTKPVKMLFWLLNTCILILKHVNFTSNILYFQSIEYTLKPIYDCHMATMDLRGDTYLLKKLRCETGKVESTCKSRFMLGLYCHLAEATLYLT